VTDFDGCNIELAEPLEDIVVEGENAGWWLLKE
jgi:hypothetical protein